MNLKEFNFPNLTFFDDPGTDQFLLEEAEKRGFNNNNKWNELFDKLFFEGGEIKIKNPQDENERKFIYSCYNYMRIYMGSFNCKHEHKRSICSMLMSEILVL